MKTKSTIAIIPARGGSKGIPRKNVRFLHGKPLIAYTINTAQNCKYIDKVIVSTDDDEIAHVAQMSGCQVVMRPPRLALDNVPLDPVIHHAISHIEVSENINFDTVITLQPTSPLLKSATIDNAVRQFNDSDVDTIISVTDDRHLSWTKVDDKFVPLYKERVNRQYLPANFRETGGFVITHRRFVTDTSRFGSAITLFQVSDTEAIDIDTYMDWWLVDKLLGRKKIIFRVDGYHKIGLGHIYRTLMLAYNMIDHEILFVSKQEHTLGVQKINESFFPCRTFNNSKEFTQILRDFTPHIVINDILDTDAEYIEQLQSSGIFVVNFEDLGSGATPAQLVINALYEENHPAPNFFSGRNYYCLRDEFYLLEPREISPVVKEILITFGGTDSHDYTGRVLDILNSVKFENSFHITVVTGLGFKNIDELKKQIAQLNISIDLMTDIKNISKYMHRADIIFTSAGRTVFEIASLGTPVIVMAQNQRELTHTFASEQNGIINLGLGYEIDDEQIETALLQLLNSHSLRQVLSKKMLSCNLRDGMDNVMKLIFDKFKSFEKKNRTGIKS